MRSWNCSLRYFVIGRERVKLAAYIIKSTSPQIDPHHPNIITVVIFQIFHLHFLLEVTLCFSSNFPILTNAFTHQGNEWESVNRWSLKDRTQMQSTGICPALQARHWQQEIQLEKQKSSPTCASSPASPASPAMHQHKDKKKPKSVILGNRMLIGRERTNNLMQSVVQWRPDPV